LNIFARKKLKKHKKVFKQLVLGFGLLHPRRITLANKAAGVRND
jgi:hypothetical protein